MISILNYYLQFFYCVDFSSFSCEDDTNALVEIDSVAYQTVELGEEGIKCTVPFAWNGQRDTFEETVTITVELDFTRLLLSWLE